MLSRKLSLFNESIIQKFYKIAHKLTWLYLALTAIVLLYTYYRAEIVYFGEYSEKYFKYYLSSLGGVLFWGIVLRLKYKLKLKIILAATSCIVGIYLVEATLNFKDSFKNFDTRSVYEVYENMRSEGVDAVPSVYPFLFLKTNGFKGAYPLYPLGGVSGKTTVLCNESGVYSIYPSDRYGFNNPDTEWDSPQIEWLLTGDSFTQGSCVQPGEDLAGQIRLVTGDSALTVGMSGNGPLLTLAALKEYAEFRKPKNVLWFYYEGNDMQGLKNEKSSSIMMNYLQPEFSQNLLRRQIEIDNKHENFINEAEAKIKAGRDSSQTGDTTHMWDKDTSHKFLIKTRMLRLFNIRAQLAIDYHKSAQSVIEGTESLYIDPLFTEILRQAKDQTASWGGKLRFIYLPERKRYLQDAQNHDIYLKRRKVIEIAKNIGLHVIDIHKEVFANHPRPISLFSSPLQPHYNATAYSEIARTIILRAKD